MNIEQIINLTIAGLGIPANIWAICKLTIKARKYINKKCTLDDIMKSMIKLSKDMKKKDFIPDVIVGIGRGGSVVAGLLSHLMAHPIDGPDIKPCDMINWGWKGWGKDREIIIHSNYNFDNKKVLITMAEDFAGNTLNKARAIIKRGNQGIPKEVKTLSFYCLNYDLRKNIKENEAMNDLLSLPDYCGKTYKEKRIMPWD